MIFLMVLVWFLFYVMDASILQTSLKWLTLLHSTHFFQQARHCLGGWLEPQELQLYFAGINQFITRPLPILFLDN